MTKTHFITWHSFDGLVVREPFPKELEGKEYIKRAPPNRFKASTDLFELEVTLAVASQTYKFDSVEFLYFESDDLHDPLKHRAIYTSHYYAIK